jgi:hypothetical protein
MMNRNPEAGNIKIINLAILIQRMKSRNVIFSLLLILALLAFAFVKMQLWEPHKRLTFNRNPSRIEYTRHALCRMDCRHISANDITEILKKGEINFAKSDLRDRPCPTFALQGFTKKGEHLRVIFAQCGTVGKVITCYSLDEEFICDCPGDQAPGSSLLKLSN